MVVNDEKSTLPYEENMEKILRIYQDEHHQWKSMRLFVVGELIAVFYLLILFFHGYPFYVVGLYTLPILIVLSLEKYKLYIYKQFEIDRQHYSSSFQIIFLKLSHMTLSLFILPIVIVNRAGYFFANDESYMVYIYIYFIQLFWVLLGCLLSYVYEKINGEKKKQAHCFVGICILIVIFVLILLPIVWIASLMLFVYFGLGLTIGDAFYKGRKMCEE